MEIADGSLHHSTVIECLLGYCGPLWPGKCPRLVSLQLLINCSQHTAARLCEALSLLEPVTRPSFTEWVFRKLLPLLLATN
jgi:hypothetical protein